MSETPHGVAVELVKAETEHMVVSAALLRRRLQMLEDHRGPGMGHDLPTIASLLARMRDAIEAYRTAVAVEAAVRRPTAGGGREGE